MTIKKAMSIIENDKTVLTQALSDLDTIKSHYAAGDYERAIDLYGAVRFRVKLAMHLFPRALMGTGKS